jgi:hypothetical protein
MMQTILYWLASLLLGGLVGWIICWAATRSTGRTPAERFWEEREARQRR